MSYDELILRMIRDGPRPNMISRWGTLWDHLFPFSPVALDHNAEAPYYRRRNIGEEKANL
jgi:hypothetical protein